MCKINVRACGGLTNARWFFFYEIVLNWSQVETKSCSSPLIMDSTKIETSLLEAAGHSQKISENYLIRFAIKVMLNKIIP